MIRRSGDRYSKQIKLEQKGDFDTLVTAPLRRNCGHITEK